MVAWGSPNQYPLGLHHQRHLEDGHLGFYHFVDHQPDDGVTNLTVSGLGGTTNTLSIYGSGAATPLRVLNAFTLGTNSALTIYNGATEIRGQAGGGMTVDGGVVTINSGSLMATNPGQANTIVGKNGTGSFLLNGGGVQFNNLEVGNLGGAQGVFTQTNGTNTVSSLLFLGNNPGSSGTYNLSNGWLRVGSAQVGFCGSGVLNQTGGTNGVNNMLLGYNSSGSGTYNLSQGLLATVNSTVGYSATGVVNQASGSHLISYLGIGYEGSGDGTYNLSGGQLSSYQCTIGHAGSGVLNQTGGTNTVGDLYVSDYYSGTGTYNLNYGLLNAGLVVLGDYGDGRLTNSSTLRANSMSAGLFGSGTLVSLDGSMVVTNGLAVGQNVGSSGAVRLLPSWTPYGTATLTAGSLSIGGFGTGSYYQNGWYDWSYLYYYSSASVGDLTVAASPGGSAQFCLDTSLASFYAGSASVATLPGSTGFLGITNGAMMLVTNLLTVGGGLNTTRTVWVAGGSTASTLYAGGILVNQGGTLVLNNAYVSGFIGYVNVTNRGTLQLSGPYSSSLGARIYNYGMVDIQNSPFAPDQGMVNFTTFTIPATTDIQFNGLGLDNQGILILTNGVLKGNGSLANKNLLTGSGTIAGSAGFANNGFWQITGGNLVLSNPGPNLNTGNLELSVGNRLQLTGGSLGNSGTLDLNGSSVVGASALVNNAGGIVNGRGLISAPFVNNGLLVVAENGTLNLTRSFTNNGLVALGSLGANLTGGTITSFGDVQGFGNIACQVINHGTLEPVDGTLNFSGSVLNAADGLIAAGSGSKVLLSAGLSASDGLISLTGGIFDNSNQPLQNNGQLDGYGTFRSGGLRNNGSVTFSGGSVTVNGGVTNLAGKTIHLVNNSSLFTGNVVNHGSFKTTGAGVTFTGSYTENGAFISDPSTNSFADLTLGAAGYLVGHAGDLLLVSGSLFNGSQQQLLWDTSAAALTFADGGTHQLQLAGADRGASYAGYWTNFAWQTVRLGTAQSLVLANGSAGPGGALYTRRLMLDGGLDQMDGITGNGHKIYYDPQDTWNAYLAGQTYALSGGGMIAPIAQPAIMITSSTCCQTCTRN